MKVGWINDERYIRGNLGWKVSGSNIQTNENFDGMETWMIVEW